MSIVTDSSGERPENVYAIHKHFRSSESIEPLYEEHKGKYKALKEALIEDIDAVVAPMREMRLSITDDDVRRVLHDGGERARVKAIAKMKEVKKAIGVTI